MRLIFIFLLLVSFSVFAQQEPTEPNTEEEPVLEQTQTDPQPELPAEELPAMDENMPEENNKQTNSDDSEPRGPILFGHRTCNNPKAKNMTQEELDALSEEEFKKLCGSPLDQLFGQGQGAGELIDDQQLQDADLIGDLEALSEATNQGTTLADLNQATQSDQNALPLIGSDATQAQQAAEQANRQKDQSLTEASAQLDSVSQRLKNAQKRTSQTTQNGARNIRGRISGGTTSFPFVDDTTGYHNSSSPKSTSRGGGSSSSYSGGSSSSYSGRSGGSGSSRGSSSSGSRSGGGSAPSTSANMGGNSGVGSKSGTTSGGSSSGGKTGGSAPASSANMGGGSGSSTSKPSTQNSSSSGSSSSGSSSGSSGSGSSGYGSSGGGYNPGTISYTSFNYDESLLFPYGDKPSNKGYDQIDGESKRLLEEIFKLNDNGGFDANKL